MTTDNKNLDLEAPADMGYVNMDTGELVSEPTAPSESIVRAMEIEATEVKTLPPTIQNNADRSIGVFSNLDNFELAQRMAKVLSSSTIVPKEFQGNLSNCMIAMEISNRLGASPTMVMQNLYIVHGKPAWSSTYIIASINSSGRFTPLEFEFVGDPGSDEWGCRATAKSRETGTTLTSPLITIGMAKAEGWYNKNGSKWKTMPELMMRYRAGSFFGKLYASDILMGMQTAEEIEDIDLIDNPNPRSRSKKPAPL